MKRIIWIDALKAFGAFVVFAAHFNGRFQLLDLPRWMKILNNGEFAVAIFLMLSGFSIAMSMERQDSDPKVKKTILKRYFRLAIPIAFMETIAYIIYLMGGFYNQEVANVMGIAVNNNDYVSISFFTYIKSLLWGAVSYKAVIGPLWMMKYIFLGSLLVILLSIGTKGLVPYKKILVVLLSMIVALHISIYYLYVLSGMILMIVHHNYSKKSFSGIGILSSILILSGWGIGCYFFRDGDVVSQKNALAILAGAMFLLLGIIFSKNGQRILSARLFEFCGTISFEIYLIHHILLCSLSSYLWLVLPSCDNHIYVWLNFILTTIVLFAFSFLVHKYIFSKSCKALENRIVNYLVK